MYYDIAEMKIIWCPGIGNREVNETKLFEKAIIPLYGDLFRYLLHLGCSQSVSKDIAQNTMEKAWANREKILYVDYKKQWMLRVAFNEYMTYLRKHSKEYNYSVTETMIDEAEAGRLTDDSLAILIKRENLQILQEALGMLEAKYAIPIRLRYFGELSHKEISDVLGLNYSTTRSVIARGLEKLKIIYLELDKKGKKHE